MFHTGPQQAAHTLTQIASTLPYNGYDDPKRDARYLLALALERADAVLPHEDIHLDGAAIARLQAFVSRRCRGEPVSRMRGRREFYGLEFVIGPATLDPRSDSEILVDTVLDYADSNAAIRMVDFGTGSGCLLLASAMHLPNVSGIGVDIVPDSVLVAEQNAERLGLAERIAFQSGSWDDGLDGEFDIIICNPPYIAHGELAGLMDEVRLYDPHLALDGGADGLAAWRTLAPIFKARLALDGVAIVEIGVDQGDSVAKIMGRCGLVLLEKRCDLGDVERCLVFAHPQKNANLSQ